MPAVILGLLALILVLWLLNSFVRSNPHHVAAVVKTSGGALALLGAVVFGIRGHLELAIPLGVTGLGLLGWLPWGPAGFGERTRRSAGQVSRVRTAFMEMELEHDTGAMHGRILVGRHEGRSLDALDVATLVGLLPEIDEESRALLATYLDRRDPAWRDHAQGDATAEEIGRAHRNLMKKLHPDQGGTTYLAARINEAKDTLLRRHR